LALFNCDTSTNVCKQTFGYIKSNDSPPTYYSFKENKTNIVIYSTTASCATDTDIGKLQTDGNLCLIDNEYGIMKDSNEYVISIKSDNIFLKITDNKNIVIKATNSAFYYDNFCSEDIILTRKASKIETTTITDSDISNLVAYSCNINGICTQVGGFVTDGSSKYYKLENSSNNQSTEVTSSLNNDCNNINQLITGGKLCVNNNINYALSFLTTDNLTKYYMSIDKNTHSLIIAKKNIFIIREVSGNYFLIFFNFILIILFVKNGKFYIL